MANSLIWGDLPKYNDEAFTGIFESLSQNLQIFNEASRNAIMVMPNVFSRGEFKKRSFFKSLASGGAAFRNPTVQATATPVTMSGGQEIGVKTFLSFNANPFLSEIRDNFGTNDPAEFMFLLGQITLSEAIQSIYIQIAAASLVGAFKSTTLAASAVHDGSAGVLSVAAINSAKKLFGDMQKNIKVLFGRGHHPNDLIANQITDKIPDTGMATIYDGLPATLGYPFIVSDESTLADDGTSASGDEIDWVFGLTEGAVKIEEIGVPSLTTHVSADKTNQELQISLEWEAIVTLKGMAFSTSAARPGKADLLTASNWSLAASSVKRGPGVGIKTVQG